ncbi:hypothetical protein ILYODFUR_019681 [Ilyodon furcidens]|uniref:Uncharacterized protein n=1 Tax=Ilyodon furcidens TaxID=33524 RepID=A0ABV0UHR2_9TELE
MWSGYAPSGIDRLLKRVTLRITLEPRNQWIQLFINFLCILNVSERRRALAFLPLTFVALSPHAALF